MLETAISLKDAFYCWEEVDRNYKYNPFEEWKLAKLIKDCLKMFYEATNHFSGTNFPTSNVFFPGICEIKIQMREWEINEHECLCSMVGPMKEIFDKYWEECNLVLAISLILDPRFEMDLVRYNFDRLYGTNTENAARHVRRVWDAFGDLFDEYMGDSSYSIVNFGVTDGSSLLSNVTKDKFTGFDNWYMMTHFFTVYASKKSEVDEYLETLGVPRRENFDILQWWKLHSGKFPVLAKMALDVLAISATTIVLKAAFSVGCRVVDESHAALLPKVVEALMTTNDWIASQKKIRCWRFYRRVF
ncbi:hypothetical protein F0562_030585 [Nyssa sinensis]|uniref:HAT C-terminal dimerisation domain-containing protein n=1 Tax=Nyssa sinensis TaxID=561372 RepID=A0A5J5B149_9ASTE|nr:hypothetical protein F0562_030585 [Nyssa sinensis]